jgi:serine/threonine-protein kinase
LDADGNTIVGAGAPALTLTAASSTVQTASTSPGAFTLQATASGSPPAVTPGTVQLTATATPVGSSAAPFSQTIPLVIAHTAVFVSNNSSVAAYFDGSTTPNVASIPGLNQPRGVAVDAGGTLYIGSHTWPGTISECTPGSGYTSCSTPISTLPYVEGVATDASGNLWITANGCDLLEFLAGATTPALDISTGFSTLRGVAADKNGNVWTANQSWPSEVAGYAPPLSTWSTPFATLTSAINAPIQVSAGGAGDIWVANSGGAVTQFAAPIGSASTPSITLGSSAGIWGAQGVAVDAEAGVWIANSGGNSVVHCPAPVSAGTCSNFSVAGPIWIAAYPSAIDP